MWVSTFHSACLRMLRSHASILGYQSQLHRLRRARLAAADRGDRGRARPRHQAPPAPLGVRRHLPGQGRADRLRDLRGRTRAATPSRCGSPRSTASTSSGCWRPTPWTSTTCLMVAVNLLEASDDVRQAATRSGSSTSWSTSTRTPTGPRTSSSSCSAAAHGNVCVVGDSRPVRLPLARGGHPQHLAVRAGLRRRDDDRARAELPLHPADPRRRQRDHRATTSPGRPKRLFTEGEEGPPIARYRAEDEHDEASFVAAEVARLHDREHSATATMAVFYRTNAQSRVFEEALVRREVPYKVVGGTRFYDRREVKDMLAYVRRARQPERRGLGAPHPERPQAGHRRHLGGPARRLGQRPRSPFAEALAHAEEAGLTGKALKGAAALAGLLEDLGRLADDARARRPGGGGGRPDRVPGRARGRAHPRGRRAHREHRRAGRGGRRVRGPRRVPRDGGPGRRRRRDRRRRHPGQRS